MTWESIDHILDTITQEPAWASYRAWQEILSAWPQVVSCLQIPSAAEQQLYPRARVDNTLFVATQTASLADHCTWQRRSVLSALNALISQPLQDIRFTSSRWQPPTPPTDTLDGLGPLNNERCLCPECDSCTPRWELDRWAECRFCVVKRWR